MADESMFTVVVGALVLIVGVIGLMSYSSEGGSGLDLGIDFSALTAPTGNLLKGFFDSDTQTVDFSARLISSEYQNLYFRFSKPVDSVALRYTIPNPSISVMDMDFPSYNMSVDLYEFKGDVIISEKITISGKVSSFTLKDALEPVTSEKEIPVKAENLSVDYMLISGISGKSFELIDVYGVVNVSTESGDIVYQKTAGDMEIRSFDGYLRIEDGVMYLEGSGILKESALQSPGI